MRAQDNSNSSISLTQSDKSNNNNNITSNNNNTSSNSSVCTTSTCPNKGKIQTLRQRKSELEKLLDEKNLLLQQIQKQEAQIIGSEWLTSSALNNTTAGGGGFHNENQQQQQPQLHPNQNQQNVTSTLRRKVGSSFKLPRINKKEHQADIENLLLEKKLQQEICNASYKLANDLTLAKSIRRNQKAEYETAQQKLSVINQNLSVLKKRQLRSHSTSFSESSPTHNGSSNNNVTIMGGGGGGVTGSGGISTLSMKSPPPPPPPLPASQSTIVPTINLGSNVNYNLNSNSVDSALLVPPKKTNNPTTISYISNTISNNGIPIKVISNSSSSGSSSSRNHPNNYSSNDRRNSIKSAILSSSSSKHDNSSSSSAASGLIQHFDRTLKNHRSDYDINRIVPSSHQIDKYQFIDGFTNDNRTSGSYSLSGRTDNDLGYSNSNYCNTFPMQQLHHQRNHHEIIDCDSKQHQQQQQILSTENSSSSSGVYINDNEFEIINNRNRTSGNFEKSSPLLSSHTKDGRLSGQYTTTIYDHENLTNMNFYHPSIGNVTTINNEYTTTNQTSCGGGDWKQNKRYDTFDTVSLYPVSSSSSANQQQQQQTGLGGFWRTLPNNERIWHSTADDSFIDGRRLISGTQSQNNHRIQQMPPSSYLSDDITTVQVTKDEISDKISISSMNSETNKKSREKQWLETSLDTPITHSKHSLTSTNNNLQERRSHNSHPQYIHHHHHHHYHDGDNNSNIFSPTTSTTLPLSATDQCNLKTISNSIYPTTTNYKISSNGNFKDRPKLSSQSMSNKMYQRSTIQQRLEDQSRLSHSTSVLNKQYVDSHHHHHQQKLLQNQNGGTSMSTGISSHENNALYFHNSDFHEASQQQQLLQLNNNHLLHHHHHQQQQQGPSPLSSSSPLNRDTSNSTNIVEMMIPSSESSMSSYIYHPSSISVSSATATTISGRQNNNFYKNFGSVLMTNMSKAQEIRVESPKNMTVIQKAVFVPYKEVTKPFEMSDFYKYSTKFRQKDQQQQQNNNGTRQQQQQQIGNTTSSIITAANSNCETRNTTTVVEEVK